MSELYRCKVTILFSNGRRADATCIVMNKSILLDRGSLQQVLFSRITDVQRDQNQVNIWEIGVSQIAFLLTTTEKESIELF